MVYGCDKPKCSDNISLQRTIDQFGIDLRQMNNSYFNIHVNMLKSNTVTKGHASFQSR